MDPVAEPSLETPASGDGAARDQVAAHALTASAVAAAFSVRPEDGLSAAEASRRLARHGPNRLERRRRKSVLAILADQLKSVIVALLAAAMALSLFVGDLPEALAIFVVLVVNTLIGFGTELRAVRSMEALARLATAATRVRRDGAARMVDAEVLVPGDIVELEAGDVVTADLRLIEAAGVEADESVLTGESAPVGKSMAPLDPATPLAERHNMAFKGSSITRGSGSGVVVATGIATELGHISALAQSAEETVSPIDRRLGRLGQRLVWLTLALAGVAVLAGVLRGRGVAEMVETGIALAVAAVPEGLPVVATLCLARGMWRMAERNALIRKLSAVETLGATTVILTDKTGTLTENRMTVTGILLADGSWAPGQAADGPAAGALRAAALCNNAEIGADGVGIGDPMELALLAAADGVDISAYPEIREYAFDPDRLMMATLHRAPEGSLLAVKGAPDHVIEACTHVATAAGSAPLDSAAADDWHARMAEAARRGSRLLALAERPGAQAGEDDPYHDLTLLGLVCLSDPVRADVPAALAACRRAGVRVIMVTGDHAETAVEIARQAGLGGGEQRAVRGRDIGDLAALTPEARAELLRADVFARVTPETKLKLAAALQAEGQIVAMTGDGVNDAPALGKADIGIAMGQRGTEVAREAADMVLKDDAFPTIVAAMHEGRMIFDNIRKFVIYLLSCNLSEVLVVTLAVGVGLPSPLLPLQILFLNLVTDVFPAFALGLGRGGEDVMLRPPRDPSEPIAGTKQWVTMAALGGLITAATLGAYLWAVNAPALGPDEAISVAFLTLALAQLWNVLNLRSRASGLFLNEVTRNPWVWGAIGLCIGLIAAAFQIPALANALRLPVPGGDGLLVAVGASFAPLVAWQIWLTVAGAGSSGQPGGPGSG